MGKLAISITPDALTKNWKSGMTNNVQKMKDGVARVTESPMAKAAANIDRQVQGVIAAAQSGKTQAALMAVDLNTWKATTAQKIGERLAGGVEAATPKVMKFAQYLIPTVSQGMSIVNQMPNATLQDSKNKMLAWVDFMHENPFKK